MRIQCAAVVAAEHPPRGSFTQTVIRLRATHTLSLPAHLPLRPQRLPPPHSSPPPLRLRIIVFYVYAENLSDEPLFPRWMLFRPRQRILFLTLPMMKAWTLCRMETTLKISGQTLTRFPPSAQLLVCTTPLRSEWHGAISTVVTIVHPWKGSSLLCGFTV